MFCRECRTWAYGAKCFICGQATAPLDESIPERPEESQFVRSKRNKISDSRYTWAMVLLLTIVIIGVALWAPGLAVPLLVFASFASRAFRGESANLHSVTGVLVIVAMATWIAFGLLCITAMHLM
jgi:hypothetical protein